MSCKILLPLDVARDCRQQVRYGADVAASMNAELCLLHVAGTGRGAHRPRRSAEWDCAAQTYLTHTVVLRGRPAEKIASYARFINADLILVPTRGRGLLGQIFFGSTTMEVLRLANRPLWVAKPQSLTTAKPVRLKRILCGVELGSQGESVLRYSAGLAKASGGDLLIVHAIPEISEAMLMLYGLDHSGEIELLPQAAHRKISSMAATLGVPYQVEARIGDVATILRKFAKRWQADVVVVGRGRRTDRWRVGANIRDIIARSPCPVMAYPGSSKRIWPAGSGTFRRVAPVCDSLGREDLCAVAYQGR